MEEDDDDDDDVIQYSNVHSTNLRELREIPLQFTWQGESSCNYPLRFQQKDFIIAQTK